MTVSFLDNWKRPFYLLLPLFLSFVFFFFFKMNSQRKKIQANKICSERSLICGCGVGVCVAGGGFHSDQLGDARTMMLKEDLFKGVGCGRGGGGGGGGALAQWFRREDAQLQIERMLFGSNRGPSQSTGPKLLAAENCICRLIMEIRLSIKCKINV